MSAGSERQAPEGGEGHSHTLAEAFALAARVVGGVLGGASLNAALASVPQARPALRAAAQDFSYKALRGWGVVDVVARRLVAKPLDDKALHGLLLVSLAELMARPQSAHSVVHQAVEATSLLGMARARGLINAVLRRFQRESGPLLAEVASTETGRHRHPQWWIDRVRAEYPADWQAMLAQSDAHPPMTLRVNARRTSVDAYLARLVDAGIGGCALGGEAILLQRPLRVEDLPGFASGEVSVQDAGAQRAPRLLDVRDGMSVLDACAAPGGKAAHILEQAHCDLLAVDSSPERARRVSETLVRLGLAAQVAVGDSEQPEAFSRGRLFDRVLLDAPCTASGVVRRHPDIKWLRRESDIASFAATQARLLDALWRVLAPDGKLLYVTCSVFPQENRLQIDAFLARHPDARSVPAAGAGQILPGATTDGFFYALLARAGAAA